jgi:hypothetical protein
MSARGMDKANPFLTWLLVIDDIRLELITVLSSARGQSMKEQQENKKRQFWWDFRKYRRRVLWFITEYEKAMEWTLYLARDIKTDKPTLILFFIPVITAFAFMVALTIAATIVYAAFMIIALIALTVWILCINLIHLFLIGCDSIWEYIRLWKKKQYICPRCHVDMKLPLHGCPECGERHPLVQPNTYGIFYHKCGKCGTKIPAIYLLGKAKLARYCPNCEREIKIDQFGFLPRLGIGIIGTPSAVKTSFMVASLEALQENFSNPELDIKLADEMRREEFEKLQKAFKDGEFSSVKDDNTEAFVWRLTTNKDDFLMYLYAPADAVYQLQESEEHLEFLRQVHGLILILDMQDVLDPDSNTDLKSVLEPVINFMKGKRNTTGQQFDIPLAVVLSSVDEAPDAPDKNNVRTHLEKLDYHLIDLMEDNFTCPVFCLCLFGYH